MASHATGDGGIPPRDAPAQGLTRIMTLGGAYGTRNHTVKNLRDLKGKRVLVETLPFQQLVVWKKVSLQQLAVGIE